MTVCFLFSCFSMLLFLFFNSMPTFVFSKYCEKCNTVQILQLSSNSKTMPNADERGNQWQCICAVCFHADKEKVFISKIFKLSIQTCQNTSLSYFKEPLRSTKEGPATYDMNYQHRSNSTVQRPNQSGIIAYWYHLQRPIKDKRTIVSAIPQCFNTIISFIYVIKQIQTANPPKSYHQKTTFKWCMTNKTILSRIT